MRMHVSQHHHSSVRAGATLIWGTYAAVPIISLITMNIWGSSPVATVWALLMLTCDAAAVWGVHSVTKSRTELRVLAPGALAITLLWLLLATFLQDPRTAKPFGPISWLGYVWLMVGASLAIVLTVRILPSVRAAEAGQNGDSKLGPVGEAVRQAKISTPRVDGPRVTADITMEPGGDIADVQQHQRRIASELDIQPSQVRVAHKPGASPRHGRLDVVVNSPLPDGIPWLPLTSPGGPVSAPIVIGMYEDWQPARIWLVGDDAAGRNAAGIVALVAIKGAGKTVLMRRIVAEFLSRRATEREFWLADPRKFGQLPAFARTAAARTAATADECEEMLDDLMALVADRAAWLGDRGLEQWVDGCGIPFLLVWIDEAAGLGEAGERLIDIGETVRSVGVCVFVAYQRFTADRVPSSFRAQVSSVICMGVKTLAEATRVLSRETIEAGADPSVWQDRMPGMAYLEASGVDPERYPVPLRVCRAKSDSEIEAELEPYVFAAQTASVPSVLAAPARIRDGAEDEDGDERRSKYDQPMEPEDDPRVPLKRRPCPPAPSMRFSDSEDQRPDAAAAAELIRQRALELCADPDVREIAPADFGDALVEAGRVPSWLTGQLKILSTPGPDQVLVRMESKGRYRPHRRAVALVHGK